MQIAAIYRPEVKSTMIWLAMLLACFSMPKPAMADPADIAAAARGVVRVVIVGRDGNELFPVSHGTGFAVAADKIVTNAHVVEELAMIPGLSIAIVPPQGGEAVPGKLLSYSPRNDLALVETEQPMRLPPLAIASIAPGDSALVSAVGYPMSVDRAQGLSIADVFRAQPPVKSRGYLSGERPARSFDTILHTAPIARGNSGGPLLDNCGRVVGVNSFGTESQGTDAEFFFAVSVRELLPFLRANGITPNVSGLPCRSMAELDAEERRRAALQARHAMEIARHEDAENERRRADARHAAELEILAERENGMALATILLVAGLAAGAFAWQSYNRGRQRHSLIAGGIAALALGGMLFAWFTRPGIEQIEQRMIAALKDESVSAGEPVPTRGEEAMLCTVDIERSRITAAGMDDIPLKWVGSGCVNDRTQYGLAGGEWTRVFVPNEEDAVTVARFDPERREYRTERYLLGSEAMEKIRKERTEYKAPACDDGEAGAVELGQQQSAILALLPARPNERLVYKCRSEEQ